MRIFLCTFVAFVLCVQSQAQTAAAADSLRRIIDQHPAADTHRVRAIDKYLAENVNNSTADWLPYINEILTISKKLNYRHGLLSGMQKAVTYYGDRAEYNRSFAYADTVAQLLGSDTAWQSQLELGILYSTRANNYHKMGDYPKAIEYNMKSATIFQEKRKDFAAILTLNISDIYTKMDDTIKATEYSEKALDIANRNGLEKIKLTIFLNRAVDQMNRNLFAQSEHLLDSIGPAIEKAGNISYLQNYNYAKASVLQLQGQHARAIPLFRKSLQYAYTNEDIHQITGVMKGMFKSFTALNELKEAKHYLDSSMILADKYGLRMRRKEAFDGLAAYYEKLGDYKNQADYLKKAILLGDSLISEENKNNIASLEVRYQVANKESEIRTLTAEKEVHELTIRQKNLLNYLLIGGAIVLLAILALTYYSYRQKQKLQQQRISELETEKQLTATEAVLQGEEQERTRLAKDLHDGLGGMLSGIKYSLNTLRTNMVMTSENQQAFQRSVDMLDGSIKEMRRVAHNMMPEPLVKFGLDTALQDFCHDINNSGVIHVNYQSYGIKDVVIEQRVSITIYRIVQELISNTIRHAAAKTAIVQVTKTEEGIAITVEDDGKGFDTTIIHNSRGIGWGNIRHRVDFLKGKLDVQSAPGKGTSVHIELSQEA